MGPMDDAVPGKKKILLLEDDPKTAAELVGFLSDFEVACYEKSSRFLEKAESIAPDLVLIDFDLREKDGLLVFRQLRQQLPSSKTIMFSSSNSIPLAVIATKLGALDFLRKPVSKAALLSSVQKVFKKEEVVSLDMSAADDVEWLNGASPELKKLIEGLKAFSLSDNDLVIFSEKGVPRRASAEILHGNGGSKGGRMAYINLSSFALSTSEAHFFLTFRELLSSSGDKGKDAPSSIYLEGVDAIAESFKASLLQFIRDKKSPVRIILGTSSDDVFPGFEILSVPNLRSRREDIPAILTAYLSRFAPEVKYIAPRALEFLMYYDFPGNYIELKNFVLQAAASFPKSEVLNLKSLPATSAFFKNMAQNRIFSKGKYDLIDARCEFEKAWIEMILSKANGDIYTSARFMDMPKTVFSQRLKALELL